MSAPDTSAEAVERVASAIADGTRFMRDAIPAACARDIAALLRALVAERDEAQRIANGGCARDQRTTQYCGIAADAYARGWREGAAAMQNMAVSTCDAAAWQHPNARLLGPELKSAGCANAIRALPLPEPQA